MPLTRGEAVGYDADLMVFKFTMRNGEQIVQCQISNAALVCGSTASTRRLMDHAGRGWHVGLTPHLVPGIRAQ